jgi:hypothetical protein
MRLTIDKNLQPVPVSEQEQAVKEKQLQRLFADAPEVGKIALENLLHDRTSPVSSPRSRMQRAERTDNEFLDKISG